MESQVILVLDVSLLDFLVRKGLSIEDYCLLLVLSKQGKDLIDSYLKGCISVEQRMSILQPLVRKLLIVKKESNSFQLEDYEITEKGREILTDTIGASNVLKISLGTPLGMLTTNRNEFDDFIDKYIELFPKGVKNGGNKPLRSNTTDVKAKMLKFINKYRHSKENILEATKIYLERLRGVYTYCPTSEYFIMKDGSSALATECDMVKNGSNSDELIDPFLKRM